MTEQDTLSRFRARPLLPEPSGDGDAWAFVVLPREVSAKLPRRGRITASVVMNGHRFEAMLEPDGRKSHWLRIAREQLESSGSEVGNEAEFEIAAAEQEPEPAVPDDFAAALQAAPDARATPSWNRA